MLAPPTQQENRSLLLLIVLARTESPAVLSHWKFSLVKIIEESVSLRVVFLQTFGTVLWFWPGHGQVTMGAEIPHGEFGKIFIGVGAGVGFDPETFREGIGVLFGEFSAHVLVDSVVADGVG